MVIPHFRENLSRAAGGPPNLELVDPSGLTQSNVLGQGRSPEGAAATHRAKNRPFFVSGVLNGDLDTRPDCAFVGANAHQLNVEPIITAARIAKNAKSMRIAG